MTPLEQTERAILQFIATADPREGKSTHWGAYSTSVGTVNGTILLDLTKDLQATGHIELKKWTDQGFVPYTAAWDDNEFFHRGSGFSLRLTIKGRRRLDTLDAQQTAQPPPMASTSSSAPTTFTYDVAISFAGEQRPIAEAIFENLSAAGIRVFYDRYEQSDLWGKDLNERLTDIYQHQARYCLLLASKEYATKVWTTVERRSAQARAINQKGAYLLPVRIDETTIDGILPTISYLDYNEHGVDGIAVLLREKLGRPREQEAPQPRSKTVAEVTASSRAFLIAPHESLQAYLPITSASWSKGKATFTCEPDDPTDAPFLDRLRGTEHPIFIAFKHNVGRCRIEDVEHQLLNGKDLWHLQLCIEETDFSPTMEFAFNNLTPDQLATQRARRILLDEKRAAGKSDNVWDSALEEVFARGFQVPMHAKASPFPALYRHYGKSPQQFVEIAWITAVMLLKTTGVVEEVTTLNLSLNGQELEVAMRGKRRKQYANQPAATVEVKGTCPLAVTPD